MSIGADKLALIDGATGETAITAMAIATIETVGSRAYVVRGDDQSGNHSITAYDPATRKALWTTPQSSNRVYMLGGTASAIYIHDNDELVRALDPATGKVLWTYGVGDTPYVYNYPDTPIITFCSGPDLKSDLVAIDPSAPAVEDEAITVTGTLTCADCETPRLDVRVGDAFGKTDEHGRFTLNTTGRGTFVLSVRFGNEWTHVKPIKLTGKKTYDLGAITTSPPPEGG
jgi:outer membrane protein assembly factor BamB